MRELKVYFSERAECGVVGDSVEILAIVGYFVGRGVELVRRLKKFVPAGAGKAGRFEGGDPRFELLVEVASVLVETADQAGPVGQDGSVRILCEYSESFVEQQGLVRVRGIHLGRSAQLRELAAEVCHRPGVGGGVWVTSAQEGHTSSNGDFSHFETQAKLARGLRIIGYSLRRAEGVIATVQTECSPRAVGLEAGRAQGAVHGGTGDACVAVGGVIRPGGKGTVGLITEAVIRLGRGVDLLAKEAGDRVSMAGKQSDVDGQDQLSPLAGLRSVKPREISVGQGAMLCAQQLDFLCGNGGGEPGSPPVQGLEVTVCGFGESGETVGGGGGYGGDVAGVFGFTVEFGFLKGTDAVGTLKRKDVAGDGRLGTLGRAVFVSDDLIEGQRVKVGLETRYKLAQVLAVGGVRQESPLDALKAVAERP